MASNGPKGPVKSVWQILHSMHYILQKGISKQRLCLDLNFLFKFSKVVRKILTIDHHNSICNSNSNSSSNNNSLNYFSALTCHSMDPSTAVYVPREVEFSCSSTPSFAFLYTSKQKKHGQLHSNSLYDDPFEILNSEELENDRFLVSSPSPMPAWSYGKIPVAVRELRVTDSPFPTKDEEEEGGGEVDRKAEEFIRWFHEELRLQRFGASRSGLDR